MSKVATLSAKYDQELVAYEAYLDSEEAQVETAREMKSALDARKAELDEFIGLDLNARSARSESKALGQPIRPNGLYDFSASTSKSGVKGLGELVVGNQSFKSFASRQNPVARFDLTGGDLKATLTRGTLTSYDRPPGVITVGVQRPVVADLIPQGETSSSTLRLVVETSFANAATVVGEGAQKPEMTLLYEEKDFPVRKIAALLPITDETLADFPFLRSYIDDRGVYSIQITEEDQLINGDGTGNKLTGFLNTPGVQTKAKVAEDTYADTIRKAITLVERVGFDKATGLVVNPIDWEQMALEKDANDQYFGPGPFYGPYGNPIGGGTMGYWGLQVIPTTAITQGTALIGAFRTQAYIARRQEITVEVSNSHADFFQYNKQAIRFEERLALAVLRPKSFVKITGL